MGEANSTNGSRPPDNDRYSGERYDPSLAHCSALELKFDGRELAMTGGRNSYKYPAVSGRPGTDGNFDYSQQAQRVPDAGPIPTGVYWINPNELWERTWTRRLLLSESHEEAWGNFRITIHPFTTTVTHTRGGFFIHGGSTPGSAGCIDLTTHMNRFVRDLGSENARRLTMAARRTWINGPVRCLGWRSSTWPAAPSLRAFSGMAGSADRRPTGNPGYSNCPIRIENC